MSEPPHQYPGAQPPYGQPPYGQPPYGQPPYGQPPYGQPPYAGAGAYEHPQGTVILILGILSLVVCALIGPIAWVMGNNALAEIDRNPMAYTNRGSVQAGRICGIIATALMILAVLSLVILLAVAGSSN